MDNNYFIAPKALGFLYMSLAVRGAFNWYPLNKIHLKYVFAITKAIALGIIALGCGLDGNKKSFTGIF